MADLLGGQLNGPADEITTGWAFDSREVQRGDIFVAVKGANVDGCDFAEKAVQSGAVAVLAERKLDVPAIVVESIVEAIAKLGTRLRAEFSGIVVGITGSAGKTTTKEFAAATLMPLGEVLKTEGNRNTEFTSPLIWADATARHRSAVVEMAMRGPGQIEHLAKVARPRIGLVTNIGYSHVEQLGSREGVAAAKGELLAALPSSGHALIWSGDEFAPFLKSTTTARISTFGFEDHADSRITRCTPNGWYSSVVEGVTDGVRWESTLSSPGRHIALAAAAAVLIAARAGVPVSDAAACLPDARLPSLRMEVREVNGATILLDAYNASPSSMLAAIETLGLLPAKGRKMAVIGEMRELGQYAEAGHRQVGRALAAAEFDFIALVGDGTRHIAAELSEMAVASDRYGTLPNTERVKDFLLDLKPGDAVLVKGSRALELERAVPK